VPTPIDAAQQPDLPAELAGRARKADTIVLMMPGVPSEVTTISRVASMTSSSFADAVDSRLSIDAANSSRVRCKAGILVAVGCPFTGLTKARLLIHIRKGCTPPIFQQLQDFTMKP
jgi:hypothetical protein